MRRRIGFLLGILSLPILHAAAQASDPVGSWATGVDVKRQLSTPASVSWNMVPLARGLASLSSSQRVAIVLDRRIDPDQLLTLSVTAEPLADVLQRIATHLGAGYCQFGPVAYLGPPAMARRLRTLAALRVEEVRALPAASTRKFLAMRSWRWEELAEPAQLVAGLATEAGVTLAGTEKIPHDLWPAADLPPLSWLDRLTLLTAQFDLSFHIAPGSERVELVSAPAEVRVVRHYAAGRDGKAVVKRWSKDLRDAEVSLTGDKIRIAARVEDHEAIKSRLRGKSLTPATVTVGPERYQLSIEKASLAKVIDELAGRLNLTITWDRAAMEEAGLSAEQLVTVKIQDADLDALLSSVLAGTGLTFQRQDRAVTILPAAGIKRGATPGP